MKVLKAKGRKNAIIRRLRKRLYTEWNINSRLSDELSDLGREYHILKDMYSEKKAVIRELYDVKDKYIKLLAAIKINEGNISGIKKQS